jgi:hypothetical protein
MRCDERRGEARRGEERRGEERERERESYEYASLLFHKFITISQLCRKQEYSVFHTNAYILYHITHMHSMWYNE